MKQSISFTDGPPAGILYRMALPMVWGLLATMSFNAVDTYFVAQLGADQLAAMSFTFPIVMVVTSLAIGLGAGMSSVMARLIGQQQHQQAKQMAGDAVVLSAIISLVVLIIGLLTIEPLFLLLGAEPELIPLIDEYMTVWYLNAPLVIISMAMSASFRSTGNNNAAGMLMLIGAIFNTILDPLLIFGWGIFPRLEIAGAAWATLITRVLMTAAAFYLAGKRYRIILWPHRQKEQLIESWKGVLHIGLPAMGTNMIIPFASGITVALVAQYGADAVAGFGVAMRIEPMVLIVFYALSGVIGPFMGQNMALQYQARQLQALNNVLVFCILFGLVIGLFLWLGKEPLARLFSDTPTVLVVAISYLSIAPISYGLYGMVMSANASFNGLGRPFPAMTISVLRVIIIYLPLALIGKAIWGLQGLFIGSMAANILTGILAYFWLRKTLLALSKTEKEHD